MRLVKKLTKVILVVAVAVTCVSAMNVYASSKYEDDYTYKFQIGSYAGNGRVAEGNYRQTTNTKNAWKVQLTKSGEKDDDYSRFWLERYDGGNVSGAINVKKGAAAVYKAAYTSASQCTVYLTGENNNFNAQTYSVEGIWDEETGVIID